MHGMLISLITKTGTYKPNNWTKIKTNVRIPNRVPISGNALASELWRCNKAPESKFLVQTESKSLGGLVA